MVPESPNRQSPASWASFACVGTVARPWGRRGEVIVASATDFGAERFQPGRQVHVLRGEAVETLTITSSREHDGRWVLGFDGIASIDDAERLRGFELRIPASELQPLGAGAYYVHDLVGCRVVTSAGEEVGVVGRVEFGAGGASLVIDDPAGEVLVPMVDAICRHVDIVAKTVAIDPPEGLLELNRRR